MRRRTGWVWLAASFACHGACAPEEWEAPEELEFRGGDSTEARPRGGGGFINNGLADPDVSGLDPGYSLASNEGLDGSRLGDPGRLDTAKYVVECALPAGESVTKMVGDQSVEFEGALGLAPEWQDEPCDQSCQEWVSACVLARTNVSEETVMLWLKADHPALGMSSNPDYPHYEASFFGNLFQGDDQAFMCKGTSLGLVLAQLDGRTCSNLVGGYCDFTSYLACEVIPQRCNFEDLLAPTAVDCKAGDFPSGPPLHTITTYVATPLL